MARIVWKAGGLVNLKLREGLYTIGQMENGSIMRFFDIYNSNGVWDNIDLNITPCIFRAFVGRVVNQKLAINRINDTSVLLCRKPLDLYWIKPYTRLDVQYKGDENSFAFLGGKLIYTKISTDCTTKAIIVKHGLSPDNDREIIEKYEMTNMWGDESISDRLCRYFDMGVNRDDLKFEVFPGLWNDRENIRPLTRRLPIPLR